MPTETVQPALRAGAAYFMLAFAAGFLLGTVRTLVLVPVTSDLIAVAIELPIMLAISWFACGWTIRRFSIPPATADRLAMGVVAFLLLMGAEAIVSVALFGRSLVEHLRSYEALPAILGLFGQIAFALLPLLRDRIPQPGIKP